MSVRKVHNNAPAMNGLARALLIREGRSVVAYETVKVASRPVLRFGNPSALGSRSTMV